MSEENGSPPDIEGTAEEVEGPQYEFGFVIMRQLDGNIAIKPVDEDVIRAPTMDDLFGTAAILQKNLVAQQTAQVLQQAMVGAMVQAESAKEAKSKIIVPEMKVRPDGG